MDGTARLWSLSKQTQSQIYVPGKATQLSPIKTLAYDDTRRVVSVGHRDGIIRQYDRKTGKKVLELGNPKEAPHAVQAMSVMGRTDFLAFATDNNIMRIWDLSEDTQHSQHALLSGVTSMLYHQSNDLLFVGNQAGEVAIWKGIEKGDEIMTGRTVMEIRKMKVSIFLVKITY